MKTYEETPDRVKFAKYVTKDLFTGKTVYVYENVDTKESFRSACDNLEEALKNKEDDK